jgi:serine/threonine protein kinase
MFLRDRGIISRDIKPENLLELAQEWIILTDLGIGKDFNL